MGLLHLHERPELDILQTKLSPIFAIKTNEKKATHYNIHPRRLNAYLRAKFFWYCFSTHCDWLEISKNVLQPSANQN